MPSEPPVWLEELANREPSENLAAPVKKSTGRRPLSAPQMLVLAILGLLLCGICAGTSLLIWQNQPALTGLTTGSQPTPTAPPAPPATPELLAAATGSPAPRPTATSMLPQATATRQPTATATYAVAPEFINKDKIRDITKFVEQWRELELPEKLPIEFVTRPQLRELWRDQAYEAETLTAVQTQQEFYKALGLLQPDVDLLEAAFESQMSQMMGYYTPEDKSLVIIAESVNMFANEEMTFAHEYTHALQDHHFDLSRIFNTNLSGDALLAARSLPEGDARLVEDLFTLENITQDQLDYSVYRYLFNEQPAKLDGVSPALGIFTFFPYTAGEYFSIYLYISGGFTWDMVNRAYANPPLSTEQVMHPEKYLAGEKPVAVKIPDCTDALGIEWREVDRDVLGEAGFLVWLIDQVEPDTAIDGAAGWDGDTYSLWLDNHGQRIVAESSIWESSRDAAEFAEAFKQYVAGREDAYHQFEENGLTFFEYNGGAILLKQAGRKVLLIIAPNRNLLYSVRNQFTDF